MKQKKRGKKGTVFGILALLFVLFKSKVFIGFLLGIATFLLGHKSVKITSTDRFCESCHVHPHSTISWKKSTHYDNDSGVPVHCVQCHLPPEGLAYLAEKAKTGARDVYGKVFKDTEKIDWDEKSKLENAVLHTYEASCIHCHQNLFPLKLSKKGEEAHLYYTRKADVLRCINCHLHVGHYSELAEQEFQLGVQEEKDKIVFDAATRIERFESFVEKIPGSSVSFEMIAIPGGTFTMGSPVTEPYRRPDEGPRSEVTISPFWIGKLEVTWDEYEAFYKQTKREGRTDTQMHLIDSSEKIDAVSGPTPPYGYPDQGWGKGKRPAITMTYYAATVYCQWLSQVTDKNYRLPTEAEWEFAARGGTTTPYFFAGNPKKFTRLSMLNRMFGPDTSGINSYVNYRENSRGRTRPPDGLRPNPFGLVSMPGNVREFCSDWYAADVLVSDPEYQPIIDPTGPTKGTEHVIRGGSYKSDAVQARASARDFTRHDAWMVTDPQIPKSLWWYSDCVDVGFRVVCEYREEGY